MRNFKFFPAQSPIGRTMKDGTVVATPEFLRALEIVKDALDALDTPSIQSQEIPAASFDGAPQLSQAAEPLPTVSVPNVSQLDTPWPIGSVFVSAVSTDPATLLGFGVWTAIGAGKFPVGYLAGDPDFGTLGGTGGAKTKAISAHAGSAVADHADHTHNVTSNVTSTTANFTAGGVAAVTSITNNAVTTGGASATLSHSVTQPNNHSDLNVLPPYLVLNFWQRTA